MNLEEIFEKELSGFIWIRKRTSFLKKKITLAFSKKWGVPGLAE
jgi:hypothetical protein